jgi:AcrR family transcriptional regulator
MKPSVRPRLLEAATVLFAEHGYSGVNVQDILVKASTNLNSFRTYFTDKKGAFSAVLEEELECVPPASEMAMMLVQNRRSQDMVPLFRTMMQNWHQSFPRPAARLLMYALLSGNDDWKKKVNKYLTQVIDVAVSSMREMEAARTAKRKFNPEIAARLLVLALFHLKVTAALPKQAKSRSTEPDMVEAELMIDQCLFPFIESTAKER